MNKQPFYTGNYLWICSLSIGLLTVMVIAAGVVQQTIFQCSYSEPCTLMSTRLLVTKAKLFAGLPLADRYWITYQLKAFKQMERFYSPNLSAVPLTEADFVNLDTTTMKVLRQEVMRQNQSEDFVVSTAMFATTLAEKTDQSGTVLPGKLLVLSTRIAHEFSGFYIQAAQWHQEHGNDSASQALVTECLKYLNAKQACERYEQTGFQVDIQ